MSNIPTAEEFTDANWRGKGLKLNVNGLMIEFAKLHVQAALKAASERYLHNETHLSDSPDFLKHSILNAYPLENIK